MFGALLWFYLVKDFQSFIRFRTSLGAFMHDSKPQITPTRKIVKMHLRLRSLSAR